MTANRIIYGIPGNTVVDVSGSDFHSQYKAVPFAGSMRLIGKLPLVLAPLQTFHSQGLW